MHILIRAFDLFNAHVEQEAHSSIIQAPATTIPVADFGLAKIASDNNTHVSTRVMGTFGYLAPKYASSGKLTDRSDVYSFGVMLLEPITGRRPVDSNQSFMDDSLVDWEFMILPVGASSFKEAMNMGVEVLRLRRSMDKMLLILVMKVALLLTFRSDADIGDEGGFAPYIQGGHIIFFQSLSLLGYCLFPLDVGALICLFIDNAIVRLVMVAITLAWSFWSAYPFMSADVNPRRKGLALYPVSSLCISLFAF